MKHVHILMVEDSIYSADLNIRVLKRAGFLVEAKVIASKEEFHKALEEKQWDIILSDNNMPGFSGLQALDIRNKMGCKTPFLMVTEDISEKDLMRAMESGCRGCIKKEYLDVMGKQVEEILEMK